MMAAGPGSAQIPVVARCGTGMSDHHRMGPGEPKQGASGVSYY